jgi:hypothetical protein
MNSEEMFQRGVADAERGELHPFYYQHYYHYRRGYDRTRRRLRGPRIGGAGQARWIRPTLAALLLIVAGAGIFLALRERSQPSAAAPSPRAAAPTARVSATTAAHTPIFPTITPSPSHPILHVGGTARVSNTEGQPLRGRQEPHLKSPAKVAFKEGEQVQIREGPMQADGYTWWRIESRAGIGWSAERSKEGVVWLQPTD